VAVSPADCRLMVFPTELQARNLWIKGQNFCLSGLFGSWDKTGEMARKFTGCSIAISRLAPQDYHRFHYPVSGVLGARHLIEGEYYTVNPIAIRRNIDVYTSNKRCICPVETKEFGTVICIAVGATMVGSMFFTCPAKQGENCTKTTQQDCCVGQRVRKFYSEHGYFAFGGSTVLMLFEPGRISFDEDLWTNSSNQLETLVRVGSRLGTATR